MSTNIFEGTMAEMTWTQIEEMAKKDALVLFPVGVIEEHGVHLPLATDIYLAVSQARDLAKEMKRKGKACLIAPPFYWGTMEVVTKNFPGSFTTDPIYLKGMIINILESLERAGFHKVLATNAHGDGLHIRTIMTAFKEFNQTHTMNVRWLTFIDDVKMYGLNGDEEFVLATPEYPLEQMIHGLEKLKDSFDVHAGAIETACMEEAFPELVNMDLAKNQKPTMLKGEQIMQWQSGKVEYNVLTPNGHVGDPASAVFLHTEMQKANTIIAGQVMDFYDKN